MRSQIQHLPTLVLTWAQHVNLDSESPNTKFEEDTTHDEAHESLLTTYQFLTIHTTHQQVNVAGGRDVTNNSFSSGRGAGGADDLDTRGGDESFRFRGSESRSMGSPRSGSTVCPSVGTVPSG
jgi:hypothetical protein